MNVVKYDPFRDLRGLQDEMNRLFSGTFSRGSQDEVLRGAWSPSVDSRKRTKAITFTASNAVTEVSPARLLCRRRFRAKMLTPYLRTGYCA